MFMLAAAITAVAAQASSVMWQYTSSVTTEDKWAGYTVYYFDTTTFNAGKDATTSGIKSELLDSALDSSALYYASGSGTARMYKTGNSGTPAARRVDNISGTSIDWTMVLVNADESEYKILGTGTTGTYDPEKESAKSSTLTKTMAAMNGLTSYPVTSSGGVPEPTSGLLLLVGAGMLALRRKQK